MSRRPGFFFETNSPPTPPVPWTGLVLKKGGDPESLVVDLTGGTGDERKLKTIRASHTAAKSGPVFRPWRRKVTAFSRAGTFQDARRRDGLGESAQKKRNHLDAGSMEKSAYHEGAKRRPARGAAYTHKELDALKEGGRGRPRRIGAPPFGVPPPPGPPRRSLTPFPP